MKHIAILDFGSQYTHLITRRIREFDVLAKIYPHDISADKLPTDVIGLILSGGPQSVYGDHAITVDKNIFQLNKPVLGICYGHQLMGQLLGGEVQPGQVREYGRAHLRLEDDSTHKNRLFENITDNSIVWMSHGDSVSRLPDGFQKIATTADCPITAMTDEVRHFYGLQFHPEVDHTEHGVAILKNFVLNICQAEQNWRIEDIVAELQENIRRQVGDKKVFILVSGGVDSSVAFALLTKTLGEDRVRGLYIDTGFMRANESEEIKRGFADSGMRNFTAVNASETFFHNLENIYEPEQKRAIIGQTFLDVKDEQIKKLGLNDDWLLGQGTIYPDVIESGGSKNSQKIKTHHNRVDAIKKMIAEGKIIEPLVDFYKFEVRLIGQKIGLPDNLINRHPFPGPGLAIRCLCQDKDKVDDVSALQKEADELFQQKYPGLSARVLPVKSVGVQGDNRTYAHPLVVWGETDWDKLDQLSSYTTNALKNINRVLLWLNPTPESAPVFSLAKDNIFLTPERVAILREIDDLVHRHIKQAGIYDDIWQFPVVLVPLIDSEGRESIGLRPFNSRDVMTVHFYRMAKEVLADLVVKIQATGKIAHLFYDITNKPPGTTEWE